MYIQLVICIAVLIGLGTGIDALDYIDGPMWWVAFFVLAALTIPCCIWAFVLAFAIKEDADADKARRDKEACDRVRASLKASGVYGTTPSPGAMVVASEIAESGESATISYFEENPWETYYVDSDGITGDNVYFDDEYSNEY